MSSGGRHDTDYSEWRRRQIDELDRDYDEYRRENQSRFESDFSTWRGQRQTKRQLLGHVGEHMDVVGSDDQPVGTVDHVRGDRIILTKNDSPDGAPSFDQLREDRPGRGGQGVPRHDRRRGQARIRARNLRNRALFERDDQGEDGPHMLNRSFSGTY